jgi:hypothetical protein
VRMPAGGFTLAAARIFWNFERPASIA